MSDFTLKSRPAHPARNHVDALDGLQKNMLDALHEDQVKEQLNDAKLRAVKQRVEYDEFEKLVKGAHLRPVKPKSEGLDSIGKAFDGFVMPKTEHNLAAASAAAAGPSLPPTPKAATVSAIELPPQAKTSNEFVRAWRRQLKTAEQRFAYLRRLEPEMLPALFRTELDAAIFDGMIEAMGEHLLVAKSSSSSSSSSSGSSGSGGGSASGGGSGGAEDGNKVAAAPAAAVDSNGEGDLDALDVGDEAPPAATSSSAAPASEPLLQWGATLLSHLSKINRFDLTLDFADKKTTTTLEALLGTMGGEEGKAEGIEEATVTAIRKAYKL